MRDKSTRAWADRSTEAAAFSPTRAALSLARYREAASLAFLALHFGRSRAALLERIGEASGTRRHWVLRAGLSLSQGKLLPRPEQASFG